MQLTVNDVSNNYLNSAMVKLASGKRINSAADDAAGLAIMEKIEAQIKGLEQGTDNTADMQNLIRTAEGGLETIGDSLLRIRELSIQASNGIYGDDDRVLIQEEVGQLLDHIKTTTQNAEFNNKKLLDGTANALHTASYADGGGMTVSIPDVSNLLSNLEGYDVTKDFDIGALDDALSAVNSVRADIGAMYNRMDHTINSNSVTILNQIAAKSRIADMDMAKGVMQLNQEQILNTMQIYSAKSKMEQQRNSVISLLA
jgi:flagellin